jgi:hypothetical protein
MYAEFSDFRQRAQINFLNRSAMAEFESVQALQSYAEAGTFWRWHARHEKCASDAWKASKCSGVDEDNL